MLQDPRTVDLYGGDLARQAHLILIRKFGDQNLVFREALPRKLDLLRAELGGPDLTPLERLLVDRVASCWLHLHYLEVQYASKDSLPLPLGDYFQRGISAAQKRYLAAIKTLALVRKLALPALRGNNRARQPKALPPPGEQREPASPGETASPETRDAFLESLGSPWE
jgi:hypothetical protein